MTYIQYISIISIGGDFIKAKVGFKVNGKWSYLLARGDLEALINEFDDLMRKDEVTQITVKFYEESKKNV